MGRWEYNMVDNLENSLVKSLVKKKWALSGKLGYPKRLNPR